MSRLLTTLILLTCMALIPALNHRAWAKGIEDEISGFTIDHTITRVGHDFSRYLSDYRNTNLPDTDYNLTIYERPSARWGSLIWVTHNHRIVFRQFLHPSNLRLQEIAQQAAENIDQQIKQIKLQALFSDTFDIDEDEI